MFNCVLKISLHCFDALIFISDLVMTEVVSSFVVGHWAVARKMVDRHVSRCTTNVILVQNTYRVANKQPREVYEQLLETFSKEGDLILDIGSGNGKEGFCYIVWQPLNSIKYRQIVTRLSWIILKRKRGKILVAIMSLGIQQQP